VLRAIKVLYIVDTLCIVCRRDNSVCVFVCCTCTSCPYGSRVEQVLTAGVSIKTPVVDSPIRWPRRTSFDSQFCVNNIPQLAILLQSYLAIFIRKSLPGAIIVQPYTHRSSNGRRGLRTHRCTTSHSSLNHTLHSGDITIVHSA
jgi:hypothetical protein